jgi:hypothetical protein
MERHRFPFLQWVAGPQGCGPLIFDLDYDAVAKGKGKEIAEL